MTVKELILEFIFSFQSLSSNKFEGVIEIETLNIPNLLS